MKIMVIFYFISIVLLALLIVKVIKKSDEIEKKILTMSCTPVAVHSTQDNLLNEIIKRQVNMETIIKNSTLQKQYAIDSIEIKKMIVDPNKGKSNGRRAAH